tara:strand:- start:187 stop:987 length:801 start_codon:yes stop_codon:yes gene_type:complete
MTNSLNLSIIALLLLIPPAILPFYGRHIRGWLFWLFLFFAIAGAFCWVLFVFVSGWRTGLAASLWVTVAASLVIFGLLAAFMRDSWRLSPLLFPYLCVLALFATIWLGRPAQFILGDAISIWIIVHIVFSVVSYGLLTISAISALAVILQERALKSKRPNAYTRVLPSVADGERIQVGLLSLGSFILGLNLLSGMIAEYFETGQLIEFGHKTTFGITTFLIVVFLMIMHLRTGARGRSIARYILVAYCFITLAYPGVKFVTDVLLV